MTTQSIIDRIIALRRLAKSDNLNEAQAAADAATKLADKYRIDEATLESEGNAPTERAEQDAEPVEMMSNVLTWKSNLAHALCRHYDCVMFLDHVFVGRTRVGWARRIVGRPSDTSVVRYLFAWLTSEFVRIARRAGKGMGKSWSNSWLLGAVAGISEQLRAQRATVKASTSSAALVHLSARMEESKTTLARLHSNLHTRGGSRRASIDGGAYNAGKAHGANVHLGAALGTKGHRQLKG